jgi:hypothetical protein
LGIRGAKSGENKTELREAVRFDLFGLCSECIKHSILLDSKQQLWQQKHHKQEEIAGERVRGKRFSLWLAVGYIPDSYCPIAYPPKKANVERLARERDRPTPTAKEY